jgi:hypothetical protein
MRIANPRAPTHWLVGTEVCLAVVMATRGPLFLFRNIAQNPAMLQYLCVAAVCAQIKRTGRDLL